MYALQFFNVYNSRTACAPIFRTALYLLSFLYKFIVLDLTLF